MYSEELDRIQSLYMESGGLLVSLKYYAIHFSKIPRSLVDFTESTASQYHVQDVLLFTSSKSTQIIRHLQVFTVHV